MSIFITDNHMISLRKLGFDSRRLHHASPFGLRMAGLFCELQENEAGPVKKASKEIIPTNNL
jgi:hypothetical protein